MIGALREVVDEGEADDGWVQLLAARPGDPLRRASAGERCDACGEPRKSLGYCKGLWMLLRLPANLHRHGLRSG